MANVDTAEIAKFEALASRWWDKNSEFKPLHDINPLRANFIDGRSPVAQKNLIDVGCGGGILAESLAQRGARVTGIDMGEAPLSVARLHALESGVELTYEQITAEDKATQMRRAFERRRGGDRHAGRPGDRARCRRWQREVARQGAGRSDHRPSGVAGPGVRAQQ